MKANVSKKSVKSVSKSAGTKVTGSNSVAAVQQIARAMAADEPLTKTESDELLAVIRRAPSALIELVLSEAEESGGVVAGIPIDVATARSDVAQAAKLRVGASAARSIARRMSKQALLLSSGVAQRVLSATTSLQAYARTPEGQSSADKASELVSARRAANKRKPKASTTTGTTPAAPSAAASSDPPPTAAPTAAAPAPHAGPSSSS
jgi:hypothetical protein